MTERATALLEGYIAALCRQYNVASREVVAPKSGFNAASVLLSEPNGQHVILTRDDVSPPIRMFSQLHEIGHIALGHVHSDPQQEHNPIIEAEINLWALAQIKPLISKAYHDELCAAFRAHEDAAYMMIGERLMTDIDQKSRQSLCINNDYVHREHDRSLFDFEAFKLYRFNVSGYRLLEEVLTPISYAEYFSYAEQMGIPMEDANAFLNSCIDAELVVVSEKASTQ